MFIAFKIVMADLNFDILSWNVKRALGDLPETMQAFQLSGKTHVQECNCVYARNTFV